jgi:hypothetical protein
MVSIARTTGTKGTTPLFLTFRGKTLRQFLFRCYDNGASIRYHAAHQTKATKNQRIMPQRRLDNMGHNVAARTLAGLGKNRFAGSPASASLPVKKLPEISVAPSS